MNFVGHINLPGYPNCDVWQGHYPLGSNPSVVVVNFEGEIVLKLSVNLREHALKARQFHAKTWSENEPFVEPLLRSGLFRDTGARVDAGFVQAQVWEIVPTSEPTSLH